MLVHRPSQDKCTLTITLLATIQNYKIAIKKINLTITINSWYLLLPYVKSWVQASVTLATLQKQAYIMHSSRPIKVKCYVVDVHITPLEK